MKRSAMVFLLLMAAASQLPAQSVPTKEEAGRAQVLVLGVYHMANPGHDIHNMQADDVLSPKRQQEMTQLIAALKTFHPTKIAIEAEVGNKGIAQQYSDYLAEKYTLSRNEDDQIGYRLAKELGHSTVYSVDESGDFPWQRVVNYAKANGRADKLDSINASWGTLVKEQGDFLGSHTVLETLNYMNSDSRVARDMGLYYGLVRYADPFDYAGPDLLAAWFQRNVRIYSNIVKLIESPNDRILVIYGAGHLGWLRQDVANDSMLRLRKLEEFTPASAAGAGELNSHPLR